VSVVPIALLCGDITSVLTEFTYDDGTKFDYTNVEFTSLTTSAGVIEPDGSDIVVDLSNVSECPETVTIALSIKDADGNTGSGTFTFETESN